MIWSKIFEKNLTTCDGQWRLGHLWRHIVSDHIFLCYRNVFATLPWMFFITFLNWYQWGGETGDIRIRINMFLLSVKAWLLHSGKLPAGSGRNKWNYSDPNEMRSKHGLFSAGHQTTKKPKKCRAIFTQVPPLPEYASVWSPCDKLPWCSDVSKSWSLTIWKEEVSLPFSPVCEQITEDFLANSCSISATVTVQMRRNIEQLKLFLGLVRMYEFPRRSSFPFTGRVSFFSFFFFTIQVFCGSAADWCDDDWDYIYQHSCVSWMAVGFVAWGEHFDPSKR